MSVTLNIVLDELKDMQLENYAARGINPDFLMCLPLPSDDTPLCAECLYVGGLSSALCANRDSGVIIICKRDRVKDQAEIGFGIQNLIIVNENLPTEDLLTLIQRRFWAVMNWKTRLDEALLRGCTMQELVDMCPPLLKNHIQITDASFMKLAQSTAVECDCPICLKLKKFGYHPDEVVESFRRHNLFQVWEQMNDIYYDPATVVAKYPTLHRIFKFHGIYYAHMVMSCCVEAVTPGMVDIYRILTQALSVCIERHWESSMSCIHPYDSFLLDLLEGRSLNTHKMLSRASYIGLPIKGAFRIMQIVRDEKQDAPLGKIMKAFSECCPRAKFVNFNETIVAFLHSSSPAACPAEPSPELLSFLEKYSSICGVSMVFDYLIDSAHYMRQVQLTIKYGLALDVRPHADIYSDGEGDGLAKQRYFLASEMFPYFFIGGEAEPAELWYHSEAHAVLSRLAERDAHRGSDDLHLLEAYLSCERRLTEAAAMLCMHRNSVLYRIRRIEEFTALDLEDSGSRELLRLSLRLARLYGFKPAGSAKVADRGEAFSSLPGSKRFSC